MDISKVRVVSENVAKASGFDYWILKEESLEKLINTRFYEDFVASKTKHRIVKLRENLFAIYRRKTDIQFSDY